jgi:hypothetical protein
VPSLLRVAATSKVGRRESPIPDQRGGIRPRDEEVGPDLASGDDRIRAALAEEDAGRGQRGEQWSVLLADAAKPPMPACQPCTWPTVISGRPGVIAMGDRSTK